MENPLMVIILGKSGCGKGTQIKLVAEKYGLKIIGTGDLLRERKKIADFTGKKISTVIDTGGIIPTPVVFRLWIEQWENLKKESNLTGIVFDGSPRKIREAYLMDEAFGWYEWDKNIKIILLDISDDEAVRRTQSRKICVNCGNIIIDSPGSAESETCLKCNGHLEKRPEDTEQGTRKRLEWFKEEVQPVIDYYKKDNRLLTVNGEQSIENVFKDVVKALES